MFGNMKLINITIKGGVIVKKELKGFAIGLIVTILLISTVLAGGVKQTIEVVLNSVNLTVNGKKVEADNILYKEATYVPIKAIAEALGKDVVWDSKTNTININDKVAEKNEGIPIKVEELPYKITILEPNSIGTRYMQATYTNKSKYPTTGISITVLLKDKNEKTYLTNYDTVMPGETSPIFETFAPPSGKYDDIEILKIEIRASKEDGKTISIEYDNKLKKYDYMEY